MEFFFIYISKKKIEEENFFWTCENFLKKKRLLKNLCWEEKLMITFHSPPVLEGFCFASLIGGGSTPGTGRFGLSIHGLVVLVRYWLAVLNQVLIRNRLKYIFLLYFFFLINFFGEVKNLLFLLSNFYKNWTANVNS